ncbi:esterase FE4 isoform X2 [Halictus rubicundus]|uniref:esterase FE4 isoform X2 n=1 Tax=Halictus rubicundus TaxID=77578 RepID=UPI0040366340
MRIRFAPYTKTLRRGHWTVVKFVRAWSTMNEPIVTVKQGKLRGAVQKSVFGSSFIAFHEIPFAAPPIGELRFKDPQPPTPWTGIKDTAEAHGIRGPQLREVPPIDVVGQEDCLYLNVYTNSLSERKPVMFWIHGGSFLIGTGSFVDKRPDYLVAKDVVVVSTNYRLGAFGFLNLGHKAAPGNQGLKDLIAALEWVKENIANFGGDPNNVTIFGASVGGTLAHALAISPRAQGLFHKAIMQSGLLTCPWSWNQSKPERGFRLAKILGTDSTDPEEVVRYLRTIDANDIVMALEGVLTQQEKKDFALTIGLNTDDMAENPVLPFPMEEMATKEACVPVIVGYTSHEFLMFIRGISEAITKKPNELITSQVKKLASLKDLGPEETKKLLKAVEMTYFDGEIGPEKLEQAVRFLSDVYFGISAKLYVEDRVKRTSAPTYFYIYTYVGTQKTHTDILVDRVIKGASHVDEMAYLFYLGPLKLEDPEPPALGTKDRATLERLTRMWSNFGKTGNPTPCIDEYVKVVWEPATKDKIKYLDIGDEPVLLCMESHILSSN